MANIKYKYAAQLEAVHNQWCVDNGYPVRKLGSRKPGRPQVHKPASSQASKLNAENSERFVEGARPRVLKR